LITKAFWYRSNRKHIGPKNIRKFWIHKIEKNIAHGKVVNHPMEGGEIKKRYSNYHQEIEECI